MKISHTISLTITPEVERELAALGVTAERVPGIRRFATASIDESDDRWPELQPKLAEWRATDLALTTFSPRELQAAKWLEVAPTWHHGYPQPEDDFEYLQVTYDLSDHCEECGAGAFQKAPFRMRKEPKWGRRGILQLNWVFDEFFVTPAVWRTVFEPLGVASRPVLNARGDRELETVVQIHVPERVDANMKDLSSESCPACARERYVPVTRGPFPPLKSKPKGHIAATTQIFGSGMSSNRAVVVSQELYQRITDHKVRGVSFMVVGPWER